MRLLLIALSEEILLFAGLRRSIVEGPRYDDCASSALQMFWSNSSACLAYLFFLVLACFFGLFRDILDRFDLLLRLLTASPTDIISSLDVVFYIKFFLPDCSRVSSFSFSTSAIRLVTLWALWEREFFEFCLLLTDGASFGLESKEPCMLFKSCLVDLF